MARATLEPRPLWQREDVDGAVYGFVDAEATQQLQWRLFGLHLVMMALFITVILAVPAWIFAALNITRSPKHVVRCLEVDGRRLGLRQVHLRGEPDASCLEEGAGTGPGPLGMGEPDEGVDLPWSELDAIELEGDVLVLVAGGIRDEISLQAVHTPDRRRLVDALTAAWMQAQTGMTRSEAEDLRDLERLKALKQGKAPVG